MTRSCNNCHQQNICFKHHLNYLYSSTRFEIIFNSDLLLRSDYPSDFVQYQILFQFFSEEGTIIHSYLGKQQSRLALHVLNKMDIVPEHVETRGLYNKTQQPTMEQVQSPIIWHDANIRHLKPSHEKDSFTLATSEFEKPPFYN